MTKYRTIVVDPPWDYPEGFAMGHGHGSLEVRPLPYEAMSLNAISGLPVRDLTDRNARVFLWATNRYLPDAFGILVEAWGFEYRQTLVWHKTDVNLPGSVAPNSAEFLLVATRGLPRRGIGFPSAVIARARHGCGGGGVAAPTKAHSRKPDCFLDHIETVSEPPYLEMFARRNRLGWDTWGDEALNHVEMTA